MKKTIAVAMALIAIQVLAGCGAKPAQDYVATGTLTLGDSFRNDVDQFLARGGSADLVMTVRTSPDVGDVIIQRRWVDVKFPFEFGLGKNLGTLHKKKHAGKPVFLTAYVTLRQGGTRGSTFALVGWTKEPIAIGTYFTSLAIDSQPQFLVAEQAKNLPTGGWYSAAVVEEAVPPGLNAGNPGPRVFSGVVDVPPAQRSAFTQYVLFVTANARKEGGAPELITRYEAPIFPFTFALHENQRVVGDPKPIKDSFFVNCVLDADGAIDTKEDQLRISTETPAAPGADDLRLVFNISGEVAPGKAAPGAGQSGGANAQDPHAGATNDPHGAGGTRPQATNVDPSEVIFAGKIILPEEFKGKVPATAALYLSGRGAKNELYLVKRMSPLFPMNFTLTRADTLDGKPLDASPPTMTVRAMLAGSGDVLSPTPDDFEVRIEAVPLGKQDLELVLKKK